MRRVYALLLVSSLVLFGCGRGAPVDPHSSEEWSNLLRIELEKLPHVKEVRRCGYGKIGSFGKKDTANISVDLVSDTDDVSANNQLLDDVGRTIITVHQNNPAAKSIVHVELVDPHSTVYGLASFLRPHSSDLDGLSKHYGIPRKK